MAEAAAAAVAVAVLARTGAEPQACAQTTDTMEIKTLQKSTTLSSLSSGTQKLGNWFSQLGERRRKSALRKSITLGAGLGESSGRPSGAIGRGRGADTGYS